MARTRDGPQATAPPADAARSTRRQNREVASSAPDPAPRPASRRGQRANSVETSDEPQNTRQTRRQIQEAALSAVTEEVSYEDENTNQSRPANGKVAIPETQLEDELGHDGDAASVEAEENYDRDLIIAGFSTLHSSASDLLAAAAPRTLEPGENTADWVDQLRSSGTKAHKVLKFKGKTYLANRLSCTSAQEGTYINKLNVSQAIFGEQSGVHDSLAQKVDEVIHLANLAEFALWLFTADPQVDDENDLLQFNDSVFAEPFMTSLRAPPLGDNALGGSSGLLEETFDVAMELRTQIAIQKFAAGDQSPDTVLQDVFYIDNDDGTLSLKTWPSGIDGPRGNALFDNLEERVLQRVEEIRSHGFLEDSQSVDLDALQNEFPWTKCVQAALLWLNKRRNEVVRSISAGGGFDSLLEAVENPAKSSRRSFFQDPDKQMALDMLKDDNVAAQTMIAPVAPMGGTSRQTGRTPAGSPPTNFAEDDQVKTDQGSKDAQIRLTQLQEQDEKTRDRQPAGKLVLPGRDRKRFVDAQENAQRVEWASQDDTVSSAANGAAVTGKGKRKAFADETEQNITDDEGFEVDSRKIDANKRRKVARAYSPGDDLSAPSASKKQRTSGPSAPSSARNLVPGDIARPSQSQVKRQIDEEDGAPPSTNYDIQAIRAQAKQNVAGILERPRQTRVPWSQAEENALLNYIEAHGISWAMIKKIDNGEEVDGEFNGPQYLRNRDQVSLKDKARNMRFDFLKAGVPMPDNLAKVTLSKTQRDRLATMNIEN